MNIVAMNEKFKVNPPKDFKWLVVSAPIFGLKYYHKDVLKYVSGGIKPLEIKREPNNQYDENAISFYFGSKIIGHLQKEIAAIIAELPDDIPLECSVRRVYVSDDSSVNIDVAVFVQTKLPISELVDRCKEINDERFEENTDPENEDDGEEAVTCEQVLSRVRVVQKEGMDIKNLIMLGFLGIVGCVGLILIAIDILKKIFGH